jgi:hypothetical protein
MSEFAELPTPRFAVGHIVREFRPSSWDRRECLRYLIRKWRAVGENPGLRTGRCKEIIREIMRVVDTAHRVTVAGIHCTGMHCIDSVSHISYIAGMPAVASGVRFEYQLMFEASIDGCQLVATVPGYTWSLRESS